ncbi:unnamed protein product [Durusdinium trenchii]|uniref:Uncharacterized protein n=1 Tax=Durusdinium trenchii TaxID=1381693 RepID=A0ABP0PKL4_9DINO
MKLQLGTLPPCPWRPEAEIRQPQLGMSCKLEEITGDQPLLYADFQGPLPSEQSEEEKETASAESAPSYFSWTMPVCEDPPRRPNRLLHEYHVCCLNRSLRLGLEETFPDSAGEGSGRRA